MPPPTWSLREEIQSTGLRWPVIVLFILVGCLLGLLLSWLLPAPFQATSDLYVGLDAYRALRDRSLPVRVETANDYKNWQMANLELVLFTQPVLEQTLIQLRQQDAYWETVGTDELLSMLDVFWRNAGRWSMVAEHPQSDRARQAVQAWEATSLEVIHNALQKSQQVLVLDARIQAASNEQARLTSRQAELIQAQEMLHRWVDIINQQPADEPLGDPLRRQGWISVGIPQPVPAWESLSQAYPGLNAPVEEYADWAISADEVLSAELIGVEGKIEAQSLAVEKLSEEYSQANAQGLGLSANLVVESVTEAPPEISQPRTTSTLVLVGGLLGLFAWMAFWLGTIAMKKRK
jgi:hypothetical protein